MERVGKMTSLFVIREKNHGDYYKIKFNQYSHDVDVTYDIDEATIFDSRGKAEDFVAVYAEYPERIEVVEFLEDSDGQLAKFRDALKEIADWKKSDMGNRITETGRARVADLEVLSHIARVALGRE